MAKVSKRRWTKPDGSTGEGWIVRHVDTLGRHRQKTFERKKEADAYRTKVEAQRLAGLDVTAPGADRLISAICLDYMKHQEGKHADGQIGYPETPGSQDRDTSRDAAAGIADSVKHLRSKALAILERSNGLTADQVAARMGRSILSIRPRITELARLGQVRDTGDRRPNASGRKAIVWAAVQPARLNRR